MKPEREERDAHVQLLCARGALRIWHTDAECCEICEGHDLRDPTCCRDGDEEMDD